MSTTIRRKGEAGQAGNPGQFAAADRGEAEVAVDLPASTSLAAQFTEQGDEDGFVDFDHDGVTFWIGPSDEGNVAAFCSDGGGTVGFGDGQIIKRDDAWMLRCPVSVDREEADTFEIEDAEGEVADASSVEALRRSLMATLDEMAARALDAELDDRADTAQYEYEHSGAMFRDAQTGRSSYRSFARRYGV